MQLPPLDAAFGKIYDLGRTLSESPRALVVEAVQVSARQKVAIKFFAPEPDVAAARAVAERLARLAALRHPNVVAVVEAGVAGTTPYLVMEYLEGGSLAARLAEGPLPLAQGADVALDCLKAISAARRKGVGVSALTAENVLLAAGGQAKLAGLDRSGAPLDDPAVVRATTYLLAAMLEQGGGSAGVVSRIEDVPAAPEPLRGVLQRVLSSPAASAPGIDKLEAALRPHAGRSAALVEGPAPAAAPSPWGHPGPGAVPMAAAEPLTDKPVILGNGRGFGATQVLNVRGRDEPHAMIDPPTARPVAGPVAALALATILGLLVLSAAGFAMMRKPVPVLLEQARDVESARASISWKTNPACFSQIEYWQATSTQNKLRSRRLPIMQMEHRHPLPDLKPDTTYNFRFLYTYSPEEDGETFASEVFDFTTRPEIQIFNIHVDEYATKAVVTWETNLRTDTTLKYGRTEEYEDLRTNPEQKAETIHSMTIEGMTPDTTYHYRILASDPRGRGQPKPSEDLQFRTSKEDSLGDAQGKENAGLVNLTKSYVDKLSRMTPDEREKLKISINKFTDSRTPLSRADKQQLLATKTSAARDDEFNNRLQMARAWYAELSTQGRKVGDHHKVCRLLQTLFYTNRVQGAQRLDSLFKRLDRAEQENQSLEDLANTLETGAEIEARPATGAPADSDPIE